MPAKNSRLNITFEQGTINIISFLAKREHKSMTSVVEKLVLESLERREDIYLSKIGDMRGSKKSKTVSHKEFWK